MNRRSFLTGNQTVHHGTPMPKLKRPTVPTIQSGTSKFTGTFTKEHAAHLLRRTTFGLTRAKVTEFANKGLDGAVDALLASQTAPEPPKDPNTGQTWVYSQRNNSQEGNYNRYLRSWWLDVMTSQTPSIIEKMTLFWHQNFAANYQTVRDTRYMYKQNALFRSYALGNIKDLMRDGTKDPAMLRFLNGNRNTKNRPNENYGRELQELFTIGKGEEVSTGNYTNYTEDDVQTAAKVLTGWRDNYSDVTTSFIANNHNTDDKTFSTAYGSHTITGRSGANAGDDELNDLLTMIFSQTETSKHYCRKLYMFFVASKIDSSVEQNVITPLAQTLRDNNFDIKPVLSQLFKSEHFYSSEIIGSMIKSPVDLVVGLAERLELEFTTTATTRHNRFYALRNQMRTFEMDLFDPPGVAGWEAYYQSPNFYKQWLNSVTLPLRNGFTDAIINNSSLNGQRFNFDPIAYVEDVTTTPDDAVKIVEGITSDLFVHEITSAQKTHLAGTILMEGAPLTQWKTEWDDYKANPTNTTKRNLVLNRLKTLMKVILRMAEFQLM